MGRGFKFRLVYRVFFFSFCLTFVCFYHGGGLKYERRKGETEKNTLNDEFKGKPLNVDVPLKQDERVSNLTKNAKQIERRKARKKTDFSKMVIKASATKTLQNSRVLALSSSSPFELNVPVKKSATTSHSNETKLENDSSKNISPLENPFFHRNDLKKTTKRETFASLTTQHPRNKREINTILENSTKCVNFTFTIKHEDTYRVWNNFSVMYQSRMYRYNDYRVTDDGLQVCNSSDTLIKQRWRNLIAREKEVSASKHCNVSVDTFYYSNYTLFRNFNVFFKPTEQSFTRLDYGVIFGHFAICSAKLSLSCNYDLVIVKYSDQYNVFKNFSLLYNNKVHDYRQYRLRNEGLEMCASNDAIIQSIWKTRNAQEKNKDRIKCQRSFRKKALGYYIVNKQLTVYLAPISQYFTKNEYGIKDGQPYICQEKFKPVSAEYTHKDQLMCNDSIINIKYDDEYKVQNDFSILYKNKVYDFTEYRVLNDSIKICNSTDNYVKNIWKIRNKWIEMTMHQKNCNKPIRITWLDLPYCTVNKQFTIYSGASSQQFTRNNYGIYDDKSIGRFIGICKENVRLISSEYTQEDLLVCEDSIINIKYDDEYKVWTNFSILYQNKVYDYTEYRVLNDGIKICNSTDTYVRNIWKVRNKWVKMIIYRKSCNKPIAYSKFQQWKYTVLKDFRVQILATKKMIPKHGYGVYKGKLEICLTDCANFTLTIKYKDVYKVWNNFSMMYQGRMYRYDEYITIRNYGLQVCNSSDPLIRKQWRNFVVFVKITTAFVHCNVSVDGFYYENYTVDTNFTVFFKPTNQSFTLRDYGVIMGYFAICSRQLRLSCNNDLVKVKYVEEYNVFKNFSLFYNKMYDYREYRFSHDGLEMCASNDSRVQAIWRTRNSWQKSLLASCYGSHKLNSRYYIVTKQFAVYSANNGQYFKRNDYAVIDGQPYVCGKENPRPIYVISNFKIILAPLCALAVSIISLLLLLIVYCMLPELRTLPGLNLMSLSFALLLWQTYLVVFLSLYSRVGKLFEIPCDRLFVVNKFMTYNIIMNAAVNIYHLRKTFCGNTLVKADELKKWNRFFRYSFFSWGIPVIITIVNIVLVKEDVLRFDPPIASVKNDVQSNLRFYQSIANGNATVKNIEIYHRTAFLKGVLHSKSKLYQSIDTELQEWQDARSRSNESAMLGKKDDANIYQPTVFLKKDVQSSLMFYERIVFASGDRKEDDARIYQQITGDCINGRIIPSWSADVDVYGLQGCLLLYIIGMFIFTAYRIRQKLKASRNIAQKSSVVKRRKFVILLKLSTTTALSYWFPLFLSRIVDFDFDTKIALFTVTLLTGAYIGIAFVFTARNHQLIRKKYFSVKNRPAVNEIPLNRQ